VLEYNCFKNAFTGFSHAVHCVSKKLSTYLINVKQVTVVSIILWFHNDFLSRHVVPSMNSLL